ncbi:hypothetical protein CRENPOLYSF1_1110012 [Crenothrix polyspora]|uniref:Uncharacterized protein n=1 Tax=Crenothrix polyspora TaxID=360316 RepID=A0A1R4GZP0_9GAMM|nr:hypothetical protein CRENPOLYSF1_1110012 [Crenothrix polyspora]
MSGFFVLTVQSLTRILAIPHQLSSNSLRICYNTQSVFLLRSN